MLKSTYDSLCWLTCIWYYGSLSLTINNRHSISFANEIAAYQLQGPENDKEKYLLLVQNKNFYLLHPLTRYKRLYNIRGNNKSSQIAMKCPSRIVQHSPQRSHVLSMASPVAKLINHAASVTTHLTDWLINLVASVKVIPRRNAMATATEYAVKQKNAIRSAL